MHQCAISAKDINPKAASPVLLLSSAFAEQRPLVPIGEENKLLEFTAYHLSFIIFYLAVLPRIEEELIAAKVQCSIFNVPN